MTTRDEDLRQARLTFYKDDIDKINMLATAFLGKSKSRACFLVDKEGHLITKCGESKVNPETIAALVAGSFAATQHIAKLLGEEEFSVLFHQGKSESIQQYLVGERVLFVIVFDDATTIGMIKLYAETTINKLSELFTSMSNRKGEPQEVISEDFEKSASEKLDSLFDD